VLSMMVFEFWAVWTLLVLCCGRREGKPYVGVDDGLGVVLLGGLVVLISLGLGVFVRFGLGPVFIRLGLGILVRLGLGVHV